MGKASEKPPDYSALADASEESARYAKEMSELQLDFSKQQYDELKPVFDKVMAQQLRMADESERRSNAYFDHWNQNAAPIERKLSQDAQRFNTEAYREQEALKARGEAESSFATQTQVRNRQMAAQGINPNAARFQTGNNALALMKGAQTAGIMNNTRQQAEVTGYARSLDASGLFRGMTGAAQGAYGMAGQLGSSAGSTGMSAGNNYMNNMQAGINTNMGGLSQQMGGLTSIMNMQGNMAGQAASSNAAAGAGWGKLAGTAIGAFGGPMGMALGGAIGGAIGGGMS